MNYLKVIVVGLGSMGRRRIRLIRLLDNGINIVGVDSKEERRLQVNSEFGIEVYADFEQAVECSPGVNCAFICTPPLSHPYLIRECLRRSYHTFTEINLNDECYQQNMELAQKKGVVLFLSSTPMYRKEIEYIKSSVIGCSLINSYIYHVGQYLPDWHPWENYKDFFVGDKRTNGCREIMAIEFPWLFDVFGIPKTWSIQKSKLSSLEVDYQDIYQILLTHENGTIGLIQFDLISRKAVRNFECVGEELYISWDGTPQGLKRYDYEAKEDKLIRLYDSIEKRNEYSASIIEDAYFEEIKVFFDTIEGKGYPRHSFKKDKGIIRIIEDMGA